MTLYGVKPKQPGDKDQLVQPHWFPSLIFLAGQTLVSTIMNAATVEDIKEPETALVSISPLVT
jgi:hypothetical protein